MDEKKEYAGGNGYFLESILENADFGIMIATDADEVLYENRKFEDALNMSSELFLEKYETYTLEDSDCQRIDLKKNF